jgi:ubiquinone/menaquinone biosynthesis C-methylase UbiE
MDQGPRDAERIKALRIDEVVSALHLRAGAVVADLGAGSGPFEPALAKAVSPGGRVYAVDIDRAFFPYIRAKAAAAGVTNVQTVLGEYADPKLPARDVDLAFMHDVLHHIQNRAAYFTNLVTYLKPGARIAIVDFNPTQSPHKDDPSLQVSKEDAGRWLKDAGFTRSEEVPLAPDKWFVIYSRK